MSHPAFFERVLAEIEKVIIDSASYRANHDNQLAGRLRELLVVRLLRPFLPRVVRIGNGYIVDTFAGTSKQIDVVIYLDAFCPPILFGDETGLFPVESVVYSIEVKSTITATEWSGVIENSRSVAALRRFSQATPAVSGPLRNNQIIPGLFAWSTDLSSGADRELQRYVTADDAAWTNPAVPFFCIVGRGTWTFEPEAQCWMLSPATPRRYELVAFLALLSNTTSEIVHTVGPLPVPGLYLTSDDDAVPEFYFPNPETRAPERYGLAELREIARIEALTGDSRIAESGALEELNRRRERHGIAFQRLLFASQGSIRRLALEGRSPGL